MCMGVGKTCKKRDGEKNNGNTHVDNWYALCMSIGKGGGEERCLVSATMAVITEKAIN